MKKPTQNEVWDALRKWTYEQVRDSINKISENDLYRTTGWTIDELTKELIRRFRIENPHLADSYFEKENVYCGVKYSNKEAKCQHKS